MIFLSQTVTPTNYKTNKDIRLIFILKFQGCGFLFNLDFGCHDSKDKQTTTTLIRQY